MAGAPVTDGFMAVGIDHTGTKSVETSLDGITWQAQATPAGFNNEATCAAYDGVGRWAVGGFAGTGGTVIITSDDGGLTWTEQVTPFDGSEILGIAYASGQWVAVGDNIAGDAVIMTSPDAVTWTTQHCDLDGDFANGVTYGAGLWVVVGSGNATVCVVTSPDAVTWTTRTTPMDARGQLLTITWGGGLFLAGGFMNSAPRHCAMSSPDGIDWTYIPTPFESITNVLIPADEEFLPHQTLGTTPHLSIKDYGSLSGAGTLTVTRAGATPTGGEFMVALVISTHGFVLVAPPAGWQQYAIAFLGADDYNVYVHRATPGEGPSAWPFIHAFGGYSDQAAVVIAGVTNVITFATSGGFNATGDVSDVAILPGPATMPAGIITATDAIDLVFLAGHITSGESWDPADPGMAGLTREFDLTSSYYAACVSSIYDPPGGATATFTDVPTGGGDIHSWVGFQMTFGTTHWLTDQASPNEIVWGGGISVHPGAPASHGGFGDTWMIDGGSLGGISFELTDMPLTAPLNYAWPLSSGLNGMWLWVYIDPASPTGAMETNVAITALTATGGGSVMGSATVQLPIVGMWLPVRIEGFRPSSVYVRGRFQCQVNAVGGGPLVPGDVVYFSHAQAGMTTQGVVYGSSYDPAQDQWLLAGFGPNGAIATADGTLDVWTPRSSSFDTNQAAAATNASGLFVVVGDDGSGGRVNTNTPFVGTLWTPRSDDFGPFGALLGVASGVVAIRSVTGGLLWGWVL